MIIPAHWAEGRLQQRVDGRQITVRRFGWSDDGAQAAQAHADARTREALTRIVAGEKLLRREGKTPYNGAEGMPIREEIVRREGTVIVTRNSYGALCLNTPDVLFVDIDFDAPRLPGALGAWLAAFALAIMAAGVAGWAARSRLVAVAMLVVVFVAAGRLLARRRRERAMREAGAAAERREQQARGRIDDFIRQHPGWHLRVYRTPAGLRALAMHRTFVAGEPAVAECFKALGADRVYARMCLNQNCFRARVSPKPWRTGFHEPLRPRPGVWPIAPERLAGRTAWVARYEEAAHGHAACAFLVSLGSPAVHPAAEAVRKLHDELSQAQSGLPIA